MLSSKGQTHTHAENLSGCLLPSTDHAERDLEIFEKLMAFDDEGLARQALANNGLKPKDITARVQLDNPWNFLPARENAGCGAMRLIRPTPLTITPPIVGRISGAHPAFGESI
jgi:hypothetical protein